MNESIPLNREPLLEVNPTLDGLAELFEQHRARLARLVEFRMDQRLQGRIDPMDVIQEAYLECARRYPQYLQEASVPVYLWMRYLTIQKLVDLHRLHLGTHMRNAAREKSLDRPAFPLASSAVLAAQLLGRLTTASQANIRAETQSLVQQALESMEEIDREILTLRHFEMLTNEEIAQVLDLKRSAASNRYVRALKRLKELLEQQGVGAIFPISGK